MSKIKLSKRLLTIAKLVSGNIICDVGCDHGKLAYYLLTNNIAKFAYVSDISKPSLEKAEKLLKEHSLNFESVHCDGLSKFGGKNIDECIIAGMGGEEIIKIISSSPVDIKTYILSPQHNIVETKKFMLNRGYNIIFDKIIKDGNKFYNIFKCEKGIDGNYSELNLNFGKNYTDEDLPHLKEYFEYQLAKYQKLCDNVDEKRKIEILKYIDLIKKAEKDWNI